MFQVSARPSRVPWPHRPSAPRSSAGAAPPSRTTRRPRRPPGGPARSRPAHRRCQRRHSHLSERNPKGLENQLEIENDWNHKSTNVNCSFSWMKYEAHEWLMNGASWDSKTQLTSHPTAEKSNTMTIKPRGIWLRTPPGERDATSLWVATSIRDFNMAMPLVVKHRT